MTLVQLTDNAILQIIMWGLGLFSTISIAILVHIGNAGAKIKEDIKEFSKVYGERIAHVETQTQNTASDVREIRTDLKLLMTRK
jgi:hypothetical protein